MTNKISILFDIQQICNQLASVKRHHYIPSTKIHESDIEHSFTVAILCWYIIESHKLPLDMAKVLQYSLVHDIAEVYAGDTHTFATKKDRKEKVLKEAIALTKLEKELPNFPTLVETASSYEIKKDDEALFVWTVDKLQAWILGSMDNWRNYKEYGIDYDWMNIVLKDQESKASPYIKEIMTGISDFVRRNFYDQPKL